MAAALLLALPAAVSAAPEPADGPSPLAEGTTAFACDLFHAVGAGGGNLFLSPWSVSSALAMARAGANGSTAAQIDTALHLPKDASAAYRMVVTRLEAPNVVRGEGPDGKIAAAPAFELNVANGVFAQAGLAFEPAFRKTVSSDFHAEFRDLDFTKGPESRKAINDWAEKQTKGRIKDLMPPGLPTPETRMVLANAIHFIAAWEVPFPDSETAEKPFTVAAGTAVQARLMRRAGRLRYGETADAQVVEILYRNGETSMLVVLPKAKDGLPAVEKALSGPALAAWVGALERRRVELELPKFSFSSQVGLAEALAKMGMADAFDAAKADFTGIAREKPLFLGAVLHKAFVAVDEKGTEAAAATAALLQATSMPRPEEPARFVADHPFLFFLVHRGTGVVLFVGRVDDPTKG